MTDEAQAAPRLNHSNASKQSPISHARDLETSSPQALSVERGKQWKKFAEQGKSLAMLARKFRCSKSHVRDLMMLASLPRDLQQAYVQGRLGRKKVLALARAHTKQVQITDETGSELQEQRQQNSDLIRSESERQAYIAQQAKLVVNWLRSTTLSPGDWEAFFRQIDLALYGPYPLLFADNAPRHTKISPEEDPWQVIRRCKPQLGTEVSLPDVINKQIDWLARWIQIVVPDRELMKETLGAAEKFLFERRSEQPFVDCGPVSRHVQNKGRILHWKYYVCSNRCLFQSSSGPEAGCYVQSVTVLEQHACFDPQS